MARPRHDGCANGIVFLQVDDPRREVRDHGDAQEIPGRVVDPKDRHSSFAGDAEPGRVCHRAAMGSGPGSSFRGCVGLPAGFRTGPRYLPMLKGETTLEPTWPAPSP